MARGPVWLCVVLSDIDIGMLRLVIIADPLNNIFESMVS